MRWIRTARETGGPRMSAITVVLVGTYFIIFGFDLSFRFPPHLMGFVMLAIISALACSAIWDYSSAKRN